MAAAAPIGKAPRAALADGEVLVDVPTGARFRIGALIGQGSMGEVYRGESEGTGAVVAIKTIPLSLVDDPTVALRTQFESSALRALRHRNVVPVYASGVRPDGVVFMVMELLSGMTLLDLRKRLGRIPIAWSLEIMRDVCLGLAAIHEHAVHRDVKPANLHFGADGVVRVLDLGLAKWKLSGMRLTRTGMALGTLMYMAPEQLDESAPVEAQADLWSVGVVLYELLADRHPFMVDGRLPDSQYVLGSRILDEPHVPLRDVAPLCPGSLALLVDRTLAKDPKDRPRSAGELAQALSLAMEAFAREHGAAPPLSQLAAQTFPDAQPPRAAIQKKESLAGLREVRHLQSTAPLDPKARRGQPAALPYLRTERIPSAVIAAANEITDPRGPHAGEVGSHGAAATGRASEPEAPRVSDVFLKRPRLQETMPDLPAPATVREALLPGAPPARASRTPTRRRAALLAVGALLLLAAGLAAVGLGGAADSSPTAPSPSSTPRHGAAPARSDR